MKRGGYLQRRTPMRRTPFRSTPRTKGVPPEVYDEVMRRAGGRCERCREAHPLQFHHRLKRSHGGTHTVENAAALCLTCHQWVEEHPDQARAAGFTAPKGNQSQIG